MNLTCSELRMRFQNKIPTDTGNVLFIFFTHQILVFFTIYLGRTLYTRPGQTKTFYEVVTENLTHWDGKWFLKIAEQGYDAQSAAFFPLYPGLLKFFLSRGFNPVEAGLLISNVAFLISCWLLYKLVNLDYSREEAAESVWYMALFPTSFFFNAVYSESVYLVLVLLAFYSARRRLWWVSGLAGMLASITRNTGVLLIIPLFYEYLIQSEFSFRKIRPGILWLGLIPAGLVVYITYLYYTLGDPLAFVSAQQYWGRSFSYPWQAVYKTLINIYSDFYRGRNLLDLVFATWAVILLLSSLRKIRFSYLIYTFLGLLVPLWAASPYAGLFSMPRFVLALFPLFIAGARLIKDLNMRTAVIAFHSGLLVYLGVMFSFSRWVA